MIDRRAALLSLAAMALSQKAASAAAGRFVFPSIDGGTVEIAGGRPALVVNTASQCAFTPQYDALQNLHDQVGDRITILAVPSSDFGGQEFGTEAEVKEFCEINFSLTLPMTEIQAVRGVSAHPFYIWAAGQGVRPRWNFHKILIDADGRLVGDFPSSVSPQDTALRRAIDAVLTVPAG